LQQTYEEAKRGFEDTVNTKEKGVVLTKEDKAHGSLLIINELMRSASPEGEVGDTCSLSC
jgi:FKBP12-rapamycin complex-associated protein